MTELQRLKTTRKGHRQSATRLVNQVETLIEEAEPDMTKLRQYKVSLEEKREEIKALDASVLNVIEEERIESEIEQADIYKEKIQLAICGIEAVLGGIASPPPPVITSPSTSPPPTPTPRLARVRLPKITLRKFDGNPLHWNAFWDSFKSTVHNNPELKDIDKFNYLNSLLERAASDAIAGLALTSANYFEAISILQKRFGDQQHIISKHMEALLNLEFSSTYSVKLLRQLYDKIECHIRSLAMLGVATGSYSSVLTPTILGKLPSDIRLVVSRSITDGDWCLDKLMSVLHGELEARERAAAATVSPPSHTKLHTKTRELSVTRAMLSCTFCEQAHSAHSCPNVTDVESRKQTLRKVGKCFNCLRRGHLVRDCRANIRCQVCRGKHHTSICERRSHIPVMDNAVTSTTERPSVTHTASTAMCTSTRTQALLQTATCVVTNPEMPEHRKEVRLILDGGSQRSYITHQLRRALDVGTEAVEAIRIKTFGSTENQTQMCDVVKIAIETRDGKLLTIPLLSVPFICDPLDRRILSCAVDQYSYLLELDLADPPGGESGKGLNIEVLIGADNYWKLVTGEVIRHENGPTAIETHIGWVLSGPVEECQTHLANSDTHVFHNSSELNDTLKRFWDLETLGIKNKEESLYDKFVSSITFCEGRYEVQLPWKDVHPPLPSNYQLCLSRLTGLIRRLKRDSTLLRDYNAVIRDQLKRGIVEVVREPESADRSNTHYIPHHAVVRRDKATTKLRIVFDASARSSGPSLNECLYAGPPLNRTILEILLRFRVHRVGLIGDIEKAFLMVSIHPDDRNYLRFLWIDDISMETPAIVTMRFRRVMFGVSSSPFLLNGTIKYHIEHYRDTDPEFVAKFLRSIYVDDVIFGAPDDEMAFKLYLTSKKRLAEGGFNLRKFFSSSPQLIEKINQTECDVTYGVKLIIEEDESYTKSTSKEVRAVEEQKVLGVRWNYVDDRLVFDMQHIAEVAMTKGITKRGVVSAIASFYDPLGIMSPCIVLFKILLQDIWDAGIDWDEPLSGDLLTTWEHLLSELMKAPPLSVPRCYFAEIPSPTCYSLRGFCDASSKAYAAIVYLRAESVEGIKIRFVTAKTRIAPRKQTIPRLELLSALLLARLVTSVTEALTNDLQLSTPICYTDSLVALYWIMSRREWKQFVHNRVTEIQKLVPAELWRHCKGTGNPADLPSRGATPRELQSNVVWLRGPQWLYCEREERSEPEQGSPPEGSLDELKKSSATVLFTSVETSILECERFSSLNRLLRVTAYVQKFIDLTRKLQTLPQLTPADVDRAETYWVKVSQQSLPSHPQFTTWNRQFNLFTDDHGILRCGGRLERANIPDCTKHPALLDSRHHLTTLIVRFCHHLVKHGGVTESLAQLRTKYWIVRGRNWEHLLSPCACHS